MAKIGETGNKDYKQLQVVARYSRCGEYVDSFHVYPIWRFVSLYTGPKTPGIAAEFVRPAKVDDQGFLIMSELREGEIVLTPGLVYKKIPMQGFIAAEHLRKLRRFQPKPIYEYEIDGSEVHDMGIIDMEGAGNA